MGLRGWRLIGVAGTLFVYISGILFLSFVSLQTPHDRHPKSKVFGGDQEPLRSRELGFLAKRPPLKWCRELTFLDAKRQISTTNHFIEKTKNTLKSLLVNGSIVQYDRSKAIRDGQKDKQSNNSINTKHRLPNQPQPSEYKFVPLPDFQQKNDEALTALASFPGSGNTWLRYLLQQSTGIYTGSVYKDYGLLKSGFPAESVFNSSVLVVKTHEWGSTAEQKFQKVILLVRDPAKAIVAEFNRQSGGHVGHASQDRYKRTKGKYWTQFVANKLLAWEKTNLFWGLKFHGLKKIIFYDHLVENVEQSIRDLLQFLEFPVEQELLACAISRKEGIYRRKKRLLPFDPFTPAMHRALDTKRAEVYAKLGRNI